MIFLSYWFVILALIAIPLYWLFSRSKIRLIILLISCLAFYGYFAGVTETLPIVILGVITYGCGYFQNKTLCIIGIAVCVLSLIFYKYTTFLTESVISLVISPESSSQLLQGFKSYLPKTAPLGVSFFVFEFVHYLYDILKGSQSVKNVLHFALFASFWPSIVAGPIKRYEDFVPQLEEVKPKISMDEIVQGLLRVASGLGKKIIADNLTVYINHWTTQAHFEQINLGWRWFFLLLIALRIYLDFSGYSDMAIGYAQMMGFRLPENFNWPYIASSLTDFWRRWHISLSTWIRDYVYIPLGGSRHGTLRKVTNGLVAFGICGLWHGAAWNFLFWGLYHGFGLAISSNYKAVLGEPGIAIARGMENIPGLAWLITFFYVCIGWLFFFYPVPTAFNMIQLLFKFS